MLSINCRRHIRADARTLVINDERHIGRIDVELTSSQRVALQTLDLQLQDVVVQLVLVDLQRVRVTLPRRLATARLGRRGGFLGRRGGFLGRRGVICRPNLDMYALSASSKHTIKDNY